PENVSLSTKLPKQFYNTASITILTPHFNTLSIYHQQLPTENMIKTYPPQNWSHKATMLVLEGDANFLSEKTLIEHLDKNHRIKADSFWIQHVIKVGFAATWERIYLDTENPENTEYSRIREEFETYPPKGWCHDATLAVFVHDAKERVNKDIIRILYAQQHILADDFWINQVKILGWGADNHEPRFRHLD
ncbi:hypothetical protein L228DRAFT_271981, partial [Xylona heveae TC161]